MPVLFLIDGSSQMYRAYHAIRGLSGPDGRSTNAVYGFTTMLRKLIADHQPEFIAASFDLPGQTFRDELVTDYKANRAPMPSDVDDVVTKFGVRPDQVVDVMALMGDTIDNIKGVPGIGDKGARELIATHGSLEALIEAAPTIPQKRYREPLLANLDSAR